MKDPEWTAVEERIIVRGLVHNRTQDQLIEFIIELDKAVADCDFTEVLIDVLMKGYKEDCD